MTGDKRDYQAYLLRLWRVNTGRGTGWHASLEDSHTGKRKGFADLKGLLTFLEEQCPNSTNQLAETERESY
jgi:hypothetical protein